MTAQAEGRPDRPRVYEPRANAPAPKVERLGNVREGSAVLLAKVDGRTIAYVADEDDGSIVVVDIDDERTLSTFRPGGTPSNVALLRDGRLIASLRDSGEVVVLSGGGTERSPLTIERRMRVAAEPVGLALSPDDATLVVTSGWGRTVTTFDTRTFERTAEHAVAREPRSVVVSGDGKRAFVSHAVGAGVDVITLGASGQKAKTTLALGGDEEVFSKFESKQARVACQGFALARAETGRVFAPHVLVFTGDPSENSSGYGESAGREAEVFNVPVLDEGTGKAVGESLRLRAGFDHRDSRCALPRAAVVGKAGLFVTCLGENSVALFDADAVNPHDVELRRFSVPSGPTGIALDEEHERAIVWSQFAHALTTLAIGDGSDTVRPLALSSVTLPRAMRVSAKLAKGRELFFSTKDERISGDGRACASCHPDGRDDSLVWSSPKGPRQTPMLAGRLDGAAPFGWNGDAADVETHLVSTFKRLGGTGVAGEDKEALVAYVKSLRTPPMSLPRDVASVERGKEIFRSADAGCSSCHGEGGDLPDGAKHDVKSRAASDLQPGFDTPSLRFVGGSAPYFHDGRYKDLKTLLTKSDGKMGHTKHLAPSELEDLTTYLESL